MASAVSCLLRSADQSTAKKKAFASQLFKEVFFKKLELSRLDGGRRFRKGRQLYSLLLFEEENPLATT